jgi:mRNA-degrading endonuclease HigB of HigAB toxin-antitoxin module
VKGKQTLRELAAKYQKDHKTLQKYFDTYHPVTGEIPVSEKPVVITMDAFFWSRKRGVLVARGNKRNILWREIESEKLSHYKALLGDLKAAGIKPAAFVIDGRVGVKKLIIKLFPDVPLQLCQFHAVQTVTKYLTKKPKLQAGKQLRTLALRLKTCSRTTFTRRLARWHRRWDIFLDERTPDESKRGWHYTHKKLRSAYRSLERNLPWLFAYWHHEKLNIPSTTNSCDGWFAHLKQRVKIHRGLSPNRRKKMADWLLESGVR